MKYLSFDIEATGLEEHDYIIEFAMVPFCAKEKKINDSLSKHFYIKCPSFEKLKPQLNSWVIEHNESLIRKAHKDGITIQEFKQELEIYLESKQVKEYFNNEKIFLFGKSMSSIDLPFMNRDLGWEWMNKHFHHRNLDLSCFAMGLIDLGILKEGMDSGEKMMNFFNMGEVNHTALADAINTAKMYFEVLNYSKKKVNCD